MKKIISILFVLLLWACFVNAQYPKRDTILYNQFRDVVEWQKEYWKNRIEKETNEPYQMIYIDISIINKKNNPNIELEEELLDKLNCLHNLEPNNITWTKYFGTGTLYFSILLIIYYIQTFCL